MTVPTDKTYPTNATNKTWQAKKTAGDKLLTKTGLGDKLTAAEKAWKAIPWDELDLSKHKITTEEEARAALRTAQLAEMKVEAAKTALTSAYDEARVTAATKGLSSGTKTAANNAVTALQQAHQRLDTVSIKEFEDRVKEMAAPAKLEKVTLYSGGNEVGTAGGAEWKMHSKELSVTGITWKVTPLVIDTYKNTTVTVHGRTLNRPDLAREDDFHVDVHLVSRSGNTAKFKGIH